MLSILSSVFVAVDVDRGVGPEIYDDFGTNTITPAYDGNGNLTDDGIFAYRYDAWNRLMQVLCSYNTDVVLATYAYDGVNRRTSKTITNCGDEVAFGGDGAWARGVLSRYSA